MSTNAINKKVVVKIHQKLSKAEAPKIKSRDISTNLDIFMPPED